MASKNYPIIISIKHEYCDLIYRGYKTIELRKTMPKDSRSFLAYIYDTSLKHITGLMDVSHILEVPKITDTLCSKACVSPDFAERYKAQGKGKLYAWFIESNSFYDENWLTLEDLHVTRAPQSWQYLPEQKIPYIKIQPCFSKE